MSAERIPRPLECEPQRPSVVSQCFLVGGTGNACYETVFDVISFLKTCAQTDLTSIVPLTRGTADLCMDLSKRFGLPFRYPHGYMKVRTSRRKGMVRQDDIYRAEADSNHRLTLVWLGQELKQEMREAVRAYDGQFRSVVFVNEKPHIPHPVERGHRTILFLGSTAVSRPEKVAHWSHGDRCVSERLRAVLIDLIHRYPRMDIVCTSADCVAPMIAKEFKRKCSVVAGPDLDPETYEASLRSIVAEHAVSVIVADANGFLPNTCIWTSMGRATPGLFHGFAAEDTGESGRRSVYEIPYRHDQALPHSVSVSKPVDMVTSPASSSSLRRMGPTRTMSEPLYVHRQTPQDNPCEKIPMLSK